MCNFRKVLVLVLVISITGCVTWNNSFEYELKDANNYAFRDSKTLSYELIFIDTAKNEATTFRNEKFFNDVLLLLPGYDLEQQGRSDYHIESTIKIPYIYNGEKAPGGVVYAIHDAYTFVAAVLGFCALPCIEDDYQSINVEAYDANGRLVHSKQYVSVRTQYLSWLGLPVLPFGYSVERAYTELYYEVMSDFIVELSEKGAV